METKILRIAQIAKDKPKEIFTSLYHLLNEELLMICHKQLDGNKATGLDGVNKKEYEENLEENIKQLAYELKNKTYKPTPAKRIYIPKSNGKVRGLAIANYEDKIVQLALKKIIESVFEPKFEDNMYGFRPNKGCHNAVKKVVDVLYEAKAKYVVEADIKAFFDNIDHKWLIRCLELHIRDTNIIRLIKRYLKAGIMEKGKYMKTETGTPQGSILSPVLANIYIYYVLVLWFRIEIQNKFGGKNYLINYADDFVCCFQCKGNAEIFMNKLLPERLKKFNLELAENKTRQITMNKYLGKDNKDTFNFLGFTFYIGKSHNCNWYIPKVKTSKDKYRSKIKSFNIWMKENMHLPVKEIIKKVNEKLRGHFNYFGVSFNFRMIRMYLHEIEGIIVKWLNRRSQKKSYTYEQFHEMLKVYPLEKPKIYVKLY